MRTFMVPHHQYLIIVNRYKFILPRADQYIDLPIEIKWDFYGRDDSISVYEDDVINELTGNKEDFEILRFAHAPDDTNLTTDIKYIFNFFSFGGTVPINPQLQVLTSSSSDWVCSYIPEGFNKKEIYYYSKPFTKSFFKLDFYDSNSAITQTNYFTVIIPVQQGATQNVLLSPYKPPVDIKIPDFTLDYVGDKEGFFLYWLRKKDFLNINPNPSNTTETFYMTAKFFDARLGVFVKMSTQPQIVINPSNPFQFNPERYFYYKVVLDYPTYTYKIYDWQGSRVGDTSPIKWYEYINP